MYDIVAIGAALLDITVEVQEEVIQKLALPKAHMTLINKETAKTLIASFEEEQLHTTPGGSAANTLATTSTLGAKTLLIGKIGDDELGRRYEEATIATGTASGLKTSSVQQGFCTALITPDKERTFATYLGASTTIAKEDIDLETIKQAKILHIEAYQLDSAKQLMIELMQLANQNDTLVSIDLADPALIQRHKETLQIIVEEHADIIFVNEEESYTYTGLSDPKEGLAALKKYCKIAIVKTGKKGSIIATEEGVIEQEAYLIEAVNTNGAGDAYAGGFLWAVTQGKTIKEAAKVAAYCGAEAVKSKGARIENEKLKEEIQKLLEEKKQ